MSLDRTGIQNRGGATSKPAPRGPKRDIKVIIRERGGFDKTFFVIVILLLCFGSVMVFSSSFAYALKWYGNSYYFASRQFIWAAVGLAAMVVASWLADPALLRKLALPFYGAVMLLNAVTPILGVDKKGVHRWIRILGVEFQPSELLKLAVVLMLAFYIVRFADHMKSPRYGIIYPFIGIGAVAVIMYFQRHFSGLIILALIQVAMIFVGGAPITWLATIVGIGSVGLGYVIMFTDYAKARIDTWFDPFKYMQGDGWQNVQSLYAIGSGGIFGVGLGQSRQKYLYLPEPQNDFIFSIVCEELGFIGALAVIALFGLLVWRGVVIALRCPDRFSSLVVMGIVCKVALQALLNIAVVTNSVPNTGISLPFFSYGGTSLLILMTEMGIILSISRYSYVEK